MNDPRPPECCGVCPPIVGGGYDCTCKGNPRCPGPKDHAMTANTKADLPWRYDEVEAQRNQYAAVVEKVREEAEDAELGLTGRHITTPWPEALDNGTAIFPTKTQNTSDPVNHPAHYTAHPSGVEPILITRHETFLRGNVLKYVMRAPYKGRELEDLLKARTYLNWEVERVENENAS